MRLILGALASPGSGSFPNRPVSMAGIRGALSILALGLLVQGLIVSETAAQKVTPVADTADTADTTHPAHTGESVHFVELEQLVESKASSRDSLMIEIRRYSKMVAALRDSLSAGGGDIQLDEEDRELLEENIQEISAVIENIGAELSELEFEIKGNTISLVNQAGEGIVINIPENLDEHLSEGLEVLSQVILSELPDSIDFDQTRDWDWTRFAPHARPAPRKVVHGNVIKVWDDLHIPAKDDVHGNVVVIFGNSEVAGRVDGNLVVIFGNLLLDDTAEVTGKIVSVGGYLDQDSDAQVGDVVSVDLWPGDRSGSLLGMLGQGILPFLMCQGTFLLTILLAVIAVAAAPRQRFLAVIGTLRSSPGPSLGLGLVLAIVGHLVVAILMAVLILTVIGIPLALLVFLALVIVIIVSVAVCGGAVGGRICGLFGGGCSSAWLTVVVGMSALHLVSFLGSLLSLSPGMESIANIFVIGGVTIKSLAFLFGLGALAVSRFGAREPAEPSPDIITQ